MESKAQQDAQAYADMIGEFVKTDLNPMAGKLKALLALGKDQLSPELQKEADEAMKGLSNIPEMLSKIKI